MQSTALALANQPAPPRNKRAPSRVTGRTKQALDLMVWEGLIDNAAAVQVGITVTAIRLALKQPHVRAYYHEQLQVLRARESAQNIHTLIEVRSQKSNQMARVQAVKALEQLDESPQAAASRSVAPGFVVVVVQSGTSAPAPLALPNVGNADD